LIAQKTEQMSSVGTPPIRISVPLLCARTGGASAASAAAAAAVARNFARGRGWRSILLSFAS
jgi:hypothetical protein